MPLLARKRELSEVKVPRGAEAELKQAHQLLDRYRIPRMDGARDLSVPERLTRAMVAIREQVTPRRAEKVQRAPAPKAAEPWNEEGER